MLKKDVLIGSICSLIIVSFLLGTRQKLWKEALTRFGFAFCDSVYELYMPDYLILNNQTVLDIAERKESSDTQKAEETFMTSEVLESGTFKIDGNAFSSNVLLQEAGITESSNKEYMPQTQIAWDKYTDFALFLKDFYQIDPTTFITQDQLRVEEFLNKDMSVKKEVEGPKILIYHTHATETFCDSTPGEQMDTVVGVGEELTNILSEKYGIEVLHNTTIYDKDDKDGAYKRVLEDLPQILEQYPSIQVVIDLHRDGVDEKMHLVTEINGKKCAQIMFFNGLSQTQEGKLTWLENPYLSDNLVFSLQMQVMGRTYFPDFTRNIYLRGYRYNMHVCPKSMLVEVGAQTNSVVEAKNAMEPLAFLLAQVLHLE